MKKKPKLNSLVFFDLLNQTCNRSYLIPHRSTMNDQIKKTSKSPNGYILTAIFTILFPKVSNGK